MHKSHRIHLKQWIETVYKPRLEKLYGDQKVNGGFLSYWESSDYDSHKAFVFSPVKSHRWFWLVLNADHYVTAYGEKKNPRAAIKRAEGYLKPSAIYA